MLYFSYGSNMDEQRVKATNRCPNARFIFSAFCQDIAWYLLAVGR
jgi:hypothetical protein